ncbi:MAG: hypothetical protein A2Y38_07555 [Spirochaetes bacterium GWB1_59_5]|nr:MAG: hypothetical protein A2Y38_07555 [Spirochaetes bacterium GWB1_59_5]
MNDEGINLAFVQSIPLDIEENIQVADLGHNIPDNQLPDHADMEAVAINGPITFHIPMTEEGREALANTTNISLTDKRLTKQSDGTWRVSDWDQPVDGEETDTSKFARYKSYSVWWHIESEPPREVTEITEHASQNYTNSSSNLSQWVAYRGSNIKIVKQDGSLYTGASSIYIRQYPGLGTQLKNVWKVLVYVQDAPEDLYLRYDKGEIRGWEITDVTGYEQAFDEPAILLSVITECDRSLSRTWMAPPNFQPMGWTAARFPDIGSDVGAYVRVFFEDHAKIETRVPQTADNHAAWFIDIKKGTFAIDVDNDDIDALNLSSDVRVKLAQLRTQMLPDVPNTIRITYSTDDYARSRQGHNYNSTMIFSRGLSGSIQDDHVLLPYPVYPGMPIIIMVTENFAAHDQTWCITNVTGWQNVQTLLTRARAAWYDGSQPNARVVGESKMLRITNVSGGRVFFDNTVFNNGQYQKYFTNLAEVRAFFYHRNSWVSFTGYNSNREFFPADLNPSLGHAFSGTVFKDMTYDTARKVWKSGVHNIRLSDVQLYDTSGHSLIPGQTSPALIPLVKWDPAIYTDTNLLAGEFHVQDYDQDDKVSLVCNSKSIPGYNLFTIPITLKMYPSKITGISATERTSLSVYDYSEKLVFDTNIGGNLAALPWDTIALAVIQVVPNTIYGQNVVFDTRSRGGGLKEDIEPVAGERHFWDIGCMDGQPYTGNMALVLEVPVSVKKQFLEKGMTEGQIEAMFQAKLKKYVAKGSLVVLQYV